MEDRQIDYGETSFDVSTIKKEQTEVQPQLMSIQTEKTATPKAIETRNVFKIRHGATAPNSDQLKTYELGYVTDGALYINSDGIIKAIGGNEITGRLATGGLTLSDSIILNSKSYGKTLPATGEEGQIFFLLLE